MASFNRVIILGNLGQDPEIRYTQNQVAVATLNIATTDYRTGADGQKQELTEWHRVVVWNKQAENCAKYLTKGRSVMVEGRLQTRSWEDKQGQKRYTTEIVAQTVQFVGNRGGAESGRGQQQSYAQTSNQSDDFAPSSHTSSSMDSDLGSLDDIPF
jgi:single-strand DNA-binding protein